MSKTTVLVVAYAFALLTPMLFAQAVGAQTSGERVTIRDALALAIALRNLDGRMVVVEQGGQKSTVMQPWEFRSGIVRLRIAGNIAIAAAVEKTAEEARIGIVRQVRKKYGVDKIEADPKALEEFSRLYDEVLDAPAIGTQELARIKASDLKLDVNEISVTVLAALRPILDQDVK